MHILGVDKNTQQLCRTVLLINDNHLTYLRIQRFSYDQCFSDLAQPTDHERSLWPRYRAIQRNLHTV